MSERVRDGGKMTLGGSEMHPGRLQGRWRGRGRKLKMRLLRSSAILRRLGCDRRISYRISKRHGPHAGAADNCESIKGLFR